MGSEVRFAEQRFPEMRFHSGGISTDVSPPSTFI